VVEPVKKALAKKKTSPKKAPAKKVGTGPQPHAAGTTHESYYMGTPNSDVVLYYTWNSVANRYNNGVEVNISQLPPHIRPHITKAIKKLSK
jgi:hypothetical protein